MNCKTAQNLALLLESGELTGRRKRGVERHLEECSGCASFYADLQRMQSAVRNAFEAVDGPSPFVITRIAGHAEAAAAARPVIFTRPVVQLAVAALLMIVALGWWSFFPLSRTGSDVSRISDMHAIIAVMSDGEYASSEQQEASEDDLLRNLARELLQMEGFGDEDVSVQEFWEPETTAPQSRSSSEPLATGCV